MAARLDAVVVGGPNGLAAATLTAAGLRVHVMEGVPDTAADAGQRSQPGVAELRGR
jgi:ribulose 1,5-bisphosphate synthetase/thiazole synthase